MPLPLTAELQKTFNRKAGLFLIFIASILVYFPSLFFKFTYFDDHVLVLENQDFLCQWTNFLKAFQKEVFHVFGGGAGYYRPFLTLSFMWDAHWAGTNPFFYHLTNVLLHAAVSCLVYLVLTQITDARALAPAPGFRRLEGVNLLLAFLFTVHPVSVQAVAWIPGRNDSLLALFILLSFYFFMKGGRHFFFHLLFFFCALFTKETALIFPVVLLFYHFASRRGQRAAKKFPAEKYYFGWAVGILVFLFAKYSFVGSLSAHMTVKDVWWSVIKNSRAVFLFVGKFFLPVNLSVLPILQDANLWIGIVLTVILLGVIGLKFKSIKSRARFMAFGFFWFLVFLLPSFVRPDLNGIPDFLEHRIYLSLVGLLILFQEASLLWESPSKKYKPIFTGFMIAILTALAWLTFIHSFNFRDRLTFWKRAAADSPHSPLAHKNLGAMWYLDGDLIQARKEFEKALELNPEETIAHNNLGLILMKAGRLEESEKEYQEELRLNPAYDNAYLNFGLLKYKMGELESAENLWQRAVELNPGNVDAWRCLIELARGRDNSEKMQLYLKKAKSVGLKL